MFMHSLTEASQGAPSTQETLSSDHPISLYDHALQCLLRYKESNDGQDLDNAISAMNNAIEHIPEYNASGGSFFILGMALLARFMHAGQLDDVEKAISAHEVAVRLTPDGHADKPSRLMPLGNSFLCRFEHLGQLDDVEKAISAHEDAVRLTPNGHADKPSRLVNLGNSFRRRFEHFGQLDDVEKAISAHEDAVRLTPDGHADKPSRLMNLGNSFIRRFEHSGQLDDVEKAISAHEDAVHLTLDGHSNKPMCLTNLGRSFLGRFEHLGQLHDVEKAISVNEDAVRLTLDGHADKPSLLTNLGNSFIRRFEHLGQLIDVEKAISAHEDAVRLTPEGHADKPVCLSNLRNSLLCRFRHLQQLDDIERAITAHDDAVRLTLDSHADKPSRLVNLGSSFLCRFRHLGQLDDIEKAISAHDDAVRLTLDGHADKPGRLLNLGSSFLSRFDHLKRRADLDNAIERFQLAATFPTGRPLIRFEAAKIWARTAPLDHPTSSLDGYATAFHLLPRLAWLGHSIGGRHEALASVKGLASEAAAVAIESGEIGLALEWLEQGRSVVWGQLLDLRSPVNELHDVDDQLADEIVRVAQALEGVSSRDREITSSHQKVSIEQATQRHHRLAEEWESLIEKDRAIPQFEDFLRPKKLSTLIKAARFGPVVALNVHSSRCDALVLMPDRNDVIHLPLNNLSHSKAESLQHSLRTLLSDAGVRTRDIRGARMGPPRGDTFHDILSSLWLNIVKPVLDHLRIPVRGLFLT